MEVQGGTATFDTDTNVPAVTVHGKSTKVRARAVIRQTGEAIAIEQIEATLPVNTISTGMGLRDEHMRKYIFTTPEGQVPDVTFVSEKAECSASSGSESTCNVSGNLTIRGTPRPFAIALKVQKAGDGYKAQGDSVVKLSTYGIERPSQLGVKTSDDVKLHLELTAKPVASASAARTPGGFR
ncbi:MAG: YceI family protein [Acidobacteria bacterium]|nr:MAG: YceI family protein [Acidobacteriota bacterium]